MLVGRVIELALSNKVLTLILEHFSSFLRTDSNVYKFYILFMQFELALYLITYLLFSLHDFNSSSASLHCAEAPTRYRIPGFPVSNMRGREAKI